MLVKPQTTDDTSSSTSNPEGSDFENSTDYYDYDDYSDDYPIDRQYPISHTTSSAEGREIDAHVQNQPKTWLH